MVFSFILLSVFVYTADICFVLFFCSFLQQDCVEQTGQLRQWNGVGLGNDLPQVGLEPGSLWVLGPFSMI